MCRPTQGVVRLVEPVSSVRAWLGLRGTGSVAAQRHADSRLAVGGSVCSLMHCNICHIRHSKVTNKFKFKVTALDSTEAGQ